MSISPEDAKRYKDEPAVLCCRKEQDTVIDAASLEEPAILPDLIDSGLLNIPDNCLTIEQAMGKTLNQAVDALAPLTPDLIKEQVASPETARAASPKQEDQEEIAAHSVSSQVASSPSSVKINIGKGEDIYLEIPIGSAVVHAYPGPVGEQAPAAGKESTQAKDEVLEKRAVEERKLIRKYYPIENIELGTETKIENKTLYIRESIVEEAAAQNDLVVSLKLDLVDPGSYKKYSETILDVQPIATKEESSPLGTGVTRALGGVVVMVTGTDAEGVQIGEFGSTEGQPEETVMWGRPGAPDKGDLIIKTEAVIKAKMNMERLGPVAVHEVTDYITQEIRQALKKADESMFDQEEELVYKRRPAKKKVLIIKEIMGQGAMHDNAILPAEPGGIEDSISIIDLGNMPVVLNPLEALDGGVHALTCVGPASKENTRHYWREPLILEVLKDEELDLAGVVFIGSPQLNSEKYFVSERLGMMVETMDVDGVFIGTEGFGNNHIDFSLHHNQMGIRGIPVVGLTFSAVQGALVMGNQYMKNMIELNKSEEGIENEILSNNTLCPEDAVRAVAMLKAVMAGEEIKAPESSYNRNVKENNLDLIKSQTGRDIETVPNETILPTRKGEKS